MNRLYFVINLIIIILSITFQSDLYLLSSLGLVQIVFCAIIMYKKSQVKLSLGVVVLLMLYLFHSGYGLLYLLDPDFFEIASVEISRNYYKLAQLYTELCIFIFPLGYVYGKKKMKFFSGFALNHINPKYFIVLFIVSLPFYIAATQLKISTAVNEGYAATFEMGSNPLFVYGSIFINSAIPLAILLLVFYSNRKKLCAVVAILIVALSAYSMTSGHRITSVTNIIALAIVYFNCVTELNKKNFLVLFAFAMGLLVFLPLVSKLRTYGQVDSENLSSAYMDMGSEGKAGFAFSFLNEFGNTVISLSNPIEYHSKGTSHLCGLSYIILPFNLMPKLPEFIYQADWYQNAQTYVFLYPSHNNISFGGSCLGESFANFGWLGCLFVFYMGLLVRLVDNALYVLKKYKRLSFYTLLFLWLMPSIITWVRGYSYVLVSFTLILLYFLWKYSLKRKVSPIQSA